MAATRKGWAASGAPAAATYKARWGVGSNQYKKRPPRPRGPQPLSSGHDAISIPFSRRLGFNQNLVTLYADADATSLMEFILDCRPEG